MKASTVRITAAIVIILATVAWLAYTGQRDSRDYYVTIGELHTMGDKAYTRHLRVAGNVTTGTIHHNGPNVRFQLAEEDKNGAIVPGQIVTVDYKGTEPPPDTFKDEAQALAVGTYGKDGVFHATQLQAKCASKYAPAQPGVKPANTAALIAPKS